LSVAIVIEVKTNMIDKLESGEIKVKIVLNPLEF